MDDGNLHMYFCGHPSINTFYLAMQTASRNVHQCLVCIIAMQKKLTYCLKETINVTKNRVALSDICSILGAENTPLFGAFFDIENGPNIVTAFDVYKKLSQLYPDYIIDNIGPIESAIFLDNKSQNKVFDVLKVFFFCAVMFFGGAIAIMTFHEDVDMRGVHSSIYRFFTGIETDTALIVSIPYSIGITIGFILLFGIFKHKKTKPTILDLNIFTHQKDLTNYLLKKSKDRDG